MRGRGHAKEAAVEPVMNAGEMDGIVGPVSSDQNGGDPGWPDESFLEPAK
jgi:hypothetical protein